MPDALAPDPFTAMAAQLTPKRAVSYIRVSTREQAQRGGSEEGFSLPAQREANKRKAQSMGALVVKEFADRGESARSANRPELQKMLAYLKEDGGIDYVIVHKLDRLARNRVDDVEINRAFEEAGVRLVSTSENIDQTPGGMLLDTCQRGGVEYVITAGWPTPNLTVTEAGAVVEQLAQAGTHLVCLNRWRPGDGTPPAWWNDEEGAWMRQLDALREHEQTNEHTEPSKEVHHA